MGGAEILFIGVLGVILLGPEKLPDLARKAARVVAYLRGIANDARHTLSEELGPEFADMDLRDLNPKTFVRKHILEEGEFIVREVAAVKDEVAGVTAAQTAAAPSSPPPAAGPPAFDPEST